MPMSDAFAAAVRKGSGELVILSKAIDADDRKAKADAVALYKMFLAKSLPTSYIAQRRMAETKLREAGGSDE